MATILLLILNFLILTFVWLQFRIISRLNIDASSKETVTSNANQISKQKEEGIAFDEGNPLDIPKDIKIEIEGGDSLNPISS